MVGDWYTLWRILPLGAAANFALIALLRVSGKRTPAKLRAFDLVVTVALGSTLATIVLSRDVTLVEDIAALLMLIALQYAIAAMAVRWRLAERLAKSDPGPVLIDGVFECEALRRERATRADVLSAARSKGFGDLSVIAAVVLETDGSLRVVSHEHAASRSALPLVRGSS